MELILRKNKIIGCILLIANCLCMSCNSRKRPYDDSNRTITYDSAVLFYDDFDINRRCYDCSFYAKIYATVFDTMYFNDIMDKKIGFYFNKNEKIINLDLRNSKKDKNKIALSFLIRQSDYNLGCGYYEDLQSLYDIIKKENLYMHADSLKYNFSFREIIKNKYFKIVPKTIVREQIK